MKLYLVQHGEAVPEDVDPERPLSDRGRDDVRALAALAAGAGAKAARIIHSGKTRARQTAEFLASAMAPGAPVEEVEAGLRPKDSTDWLFGNVGRWTDDTMAVGHQPFMGKMVSRLVVGSDGADLVSFVPGTVVCLERGPGDGKWTIAWMLNPNFSGE